jgi:hypothetical protein
MDNRIVRMGVAFNLTDPDQEELYVFARRRTNFSGYVKRLILKDMLGAPQQPRIITSNNHWDGGEADSFI